MLKKLKLERPLAFIDVETTGVKPHLDRIVELSILKIEPNGSPGYKSHRINPEVPIPREATAIHGMSDTDVSAEPTFRQYAQSIRDFIEGCDISGFNVLTFDLPFLESEFARAEVHCNLQNRQIVDSMIIFHQKVSREQIGARNLKAAYLYYCGKELENAHGAENDVTASAEVLDGQIVMHSELPSDVSGLCAFCNEVRKNFVDLEGKFILEEGEVVFNFGKHTGRPLKEIALEYPDYLRWILGSDFRPDVYDIVSNALNSESP